MLYLVVCSDVISILTIMVDIVVNTPTPFGVLTTYPNHCTRDFRTALSLLPGRWTAAVARGVFGSSSLLGFTVCGKSRALSAPSNCLPVYFIPGRRQ